MEIDEVVQSQLEKAMAAAHEAGKKAGAERLDMDPVKAVECRGLSRDRAASGRER